MPTPEEIAASQAIWAAWEAAGRPFPIPDVPEYLSMADLAAKYGTYPTVGGPVPILPGHVKVTDFVCPVTGEAAEGYLEYGGVLVSSKLAGAIANPEHPKFDDAIKERAARSAAFRERRRELEAELDALMAEEVAG